jgi:hypothetical protein
LEWSTTAPRRSEPAAGQRAHVSVPEGDEAQRRGATSP